MGQDATASWIPCPEVTKSVTSSVYMLCFKGASVLDKGSLLPIGIWPVFVAIAQLEIQSVQILLCIQSTAYVFQVGVTTYTSNE